VVLLFIVRLPMPKMGVKDERYEDNGSGGVVISTFEEAF
jgi:hypothetical protein